MKRSLVFVICLLLLLCTTVHSVAEYTKQENLPQNIIIILCSKDGFDNFSELDLNTMKEAVETISFVSEQNGAQVTVYGTQGDASEKIIYKTADSNKGFSWDNLKGTSNTDHLLRLTISRKGDNADHVIMFLGDLGTPGRGQLSTESTYAWLSKKDITCFALYPNTIEQFKSATRGLLSIDTEIKEYDRYGINHVSGLFSYADIDGLKGIIKNNDLNTTENSVEALKNRLIDAATRLFHSGIPTSYIFSPDEDANGCLSANIPFTIIDHSILVIRTAMQQEGQMHLQLVVPNQLNELDKTDNADNVNSQNTDGNSNVFDNTIINLSSDVDNSNLHVIKKDNEYIYLYAPECEPTDSLNGKWIIQTGTSDSPSVYGERENSDHKDVDISAFLMGSIDVSGWNGKIAITEAASIEEDQEINSGEEDQKFIKHYKYSICPNTDDPMVNALIHVPGVHFVLTSQEDSSADKEQVNPSYHLTNSDGTYNSSASNPIVEFENAGKYTFTAGLYDAENNILIWNDLEFDVINYDPIVIDTGYEPQDWTWDREGEQNISFSGWFLDRDNTGALSYSVSGLPEWMDVSIDEENKELIVDYSKAISDGSVEIILSAEDEDRATAERPITLQWHSLMNKLNTIEFTAIQDDSAVIQKNEDIMLKVQAIYEDDEEIREYIRDCTEAQFIIRQEGQPEVTLKAEFDAENSVFSIDKAWTPEKIKGELPVLFCIKSRTDEKPAWDWNNEDNAIVTYYVDNKTPTYCPDQAIEEKNWTVDKDLPEKITEKIDFSSWFIDEDGDALRYEIGVQDNESGITLFNDEQTHNFNDETAYVMLDFTNARPAGETELHIRAYDEATEYSKDAKVKIAWHNLVDRLDELEWTPSIEREKSEYESDEKINKAELITLYAWIICDDQEVLDFIKNQAEVSFIISWSGEPLCAGLCEEKSEEEKLTFKAQINAPKNEGVKQIDLMVSDREKTLPNWDGVKKDNFISIEVGNNPPRVNNPTNTSSISSVCWWPKDKEYVLEDVLFTDTDDQDDLIYSIEFIVEKLYKDGNEYYFLWNDNADNNENCISDITEQPKSIKINEDSFSRYKPFDFGKQEYQFTLLAEDTDNESAKITFSITIYNLVYFGITVAIITAIALAIIIPLILFLIKPTYKHCYAQMDIENEHIKLDLSKWGKKDAQLFAFIPLVNTVLTTDECELILALRIRRKHKHDILYSSKKSVMINNSAHSVEIDNNPIKVNDRICLRLIIE